MTGETEPEAEPEPAPAELPVADAIKSLVHYLASRPTHLPLWQYEDITAKGVVPHHLSSPPSFHIKKKYT